MHGWRFVPTTVRVRHASHRTGSSCLTPPSNVWPSLPRATMIASSPSSGWIGCWPTTRGGCGSQIRGGRCSGCWSCRSTFGRSHTAKPGVGHFGRPSARDVPGRLGSRTLARLGGPLRLAASGQTQHIGPRFGCVCGGTLGGNIYCLPAMAVGNQRA